ncbi:MAG: ABC transporter permease subunit, partial [Bullifex porci]
DENILYSSYLLGASTRKASKSVEIPLLRNVVIKAFSFSFALSIGEINATMTLSEGKITTLPLLLYRLINSYNYQGACAVGSILILIALIVFFISELIGGKNGKTES